MIRLFYSLTAAQGRMAYRRAPTDQARDKIQAILTEINRERRGPRRQLRATHVLRYQLRLIQAEIEWITGKD
jgi:hypothetical protein